MVEAISTRQCHWCQGAISNEDYYLGSFSFPSVTEDICLCSPPCIRSYADAFEGIDGYRYLEPPLVQHFVNGEPQLHFADQFVRLFR